MGKKVFWISVLACGIAVVMVPSSHLILRLTTDFDLLAIILAFPLLLNVYLFAFLTSFVLGYFFLLRSVRFLRSRFGSILGAIVILFFLVSCPIGGYIAYFWKSHSVSTAKPPKVGPFGESQY